MKKLNMKRVKVKKVKKTRKEDPKRALCEKERRCGLPCSRAARVSRVQDVRFGVQGAGSKKCEKCGGDLERALGEEERGGGRGWDGQERVRVEGLGCGVQGLGFEP